MIIARIVTSVNQFRIFMSYDNLSYGVACFFLFFFFFTRDRVSQGYICGLLLLFLPIRDIIKKNSNTSVSIGILLDCYSTIRNWIVAIIITRNPDERMRKLQRE